MATKPLKIKIITGFPKGETFKGPFKIKQNSELASMVTETNVIRYRSWKPLVTRMM